MHKPFSRLAGRRPLDACRRGNRSTPAHAGIKPNGLTYSPIIRCGNLIRNMAAGA